MKARIHITGAAAIGPQHTFDKEAIEQVVRYESHPLEVIMPDPTGVIDPNRSRRMTRHGRIGIMAATCAMRRSGAETPGAIILATGDGCKDSVARFLDTMIDHDETVANPTAFIGSTHNSLAGQIALALNSRGYNYTYLQRGLSFPSALMDAMLQVGREGVRNVLVGAADVITTDFFTTHRPTGLWKEGPVSNLDVLDRTDRGALAGEGAAFFVLDSEPTPDSIELLGSEGFFEPAPLDITLNVSDFLDRNGKKASDIDILFLGYNGDHIEDRAYDRLRDAFPKATIAAYKPLCGEFYTANAFGTWCAWSALRSGKVPQEAVLQGHAKGSFGTALLYDHFQLKDHSFVLLSR